MKTALLALAALCLTQPVLAGGLTLEDAALQASAISRRAALLRPVAAVQPAGNPHRRGMAKITGTTHRFMFNVTINKATGEVSGLGNDQGVSLKVDYDKGTLTGQANGERIEMTFNEDSGRMGGRANGSQSDYVVSSQRVTGKLNGADVTLIVDPTGLRGSFAGRHVFLTYDDATGALEGSAAGTQVALQLENLTVHELASTYLFLLFPGRP